MDTLACCVQTSQTYSTYRIHQFLLVATCIIHRHHAACVFCMQSNNFPYCLVPDALLLQLSFPLMHSFLLLAARSDDTNHTRSSESVVSVCGAARTAQGICSCSVCSLCSGPFFSLLRRTRLSIMLRVLFCFGSLDHTIKQHKWLSPFLICVQLAQGMHVHILYVLVVLFFAFRFSDEYPLNSEELACPLVCVFFFGHLCDTIK